MLTKPECLALEEAQRLKDMYQPDSDAAELGRAIHTVCSRYRAALRHIDSLLWGIERACPKMVDTEAFKLISEWYTTAIDVSEQGEGNG